MQRMSSFPPLVGPESVEREIRRLFDAGGSNGLVIRVHGEEGPSSPEAMASFRELLRSLRQYDYFDANGEQVLVQPPSKDVLRRALTVLSRAEHERRILDHILTTFGRRLIEPLGCMLDASREGSLLSRLSMLREIFLVQTKDLRLTRDTEEMLLGDLKKLLTDEYLAMIAENEERVQRPRVEKLAQAILRLIGATFHRAFRGWPAHADRIATTITRRMQGPVSLKENPAVLRRHITESIEEFLRVETSAELEGALVHLFGDYADVVGDKPPVIDRAMYASFAAACWDLIAENC